MADGQPPLQMPVIAGRVVVAVVCILHGCRHIVGRTELLITASRCDQHGHKAGGSNNNILTKKREGKRTQTQHLSWPQKTKGDRLLAVYVLNNKIPIVWRRKRIRINSSNSFDHFSCLECSSTFAIIQISQRAPHSSAAIGRDFVLLVLYSILHNSRRLASYLLYAGPSTSCFLQGVREQREGEAKGKLKRSARIYSRPDRGQKGEPCRPFSSRREHAKHITSWQGKWNQVK